MLIIPSFLHIVEFPSFKRAQVSFLVEVKFGDPRSSEVQLGESCKHAISRTVTRTGNNKLNELILVEMYGDLKSWSV